MKKILNAIKDFFLQGKYKALLQYADEAIVAVNILKKVVDNPAVNFYVEATKTKIDDAILEQMRVVLPQVLKYLQYANEANKCAQMTGVAQIQCIANTLRNLNEQQRNIFYREVGAKILLHATDFSRSEIDTALQVRYFESKNS